MLLKCFNDSISGSPVNYFIVCCERPFLLHLFCQIFFKFVHINVCSSTL